MALKQVTIIRPKGDLGESNPRLDHFLAQSIEKALGQPLSKGMIRKLIVAGAVYLNGKRVRIASKEVYRGAKIDVHVDLDRLSSVNREVESKFEITPDLILFENDDLIVVKKPSGITTQPTIDKSRNTLYTALYRYVRSKRGENAYLGLHHRLDRDTSGVILFTLNPEMNKPIADAFQNHRVKKTYLARVAYPDRLPKEEKFVVKNFLKKDPKSNRNLAKYISTKSGGDSAETHFRVIDRQKGLVECSPITGRTHQIRVHLSELGCPIVGDIIYADKASMTMSSRLLLHAKKIEIEISGQNSFAVEAPTPHQFV